MTKLSVDRTSRVERKKVERLLRSVVEWHDTEYFISSLIIIAIDPLSTTAWPDGVELVRREVEEVCDAILERNVEMADIVSSGAVLRSNLCECCDVNARSRRGKGVAPSCCDKQHSIAGY